MPPDALVFSVTSIACTVQKAYVTFVGIMFRQGTMEQGGNKEGPVPSRFVELPQRSGLQLLGTKQTFSLAPAAVTGHSLQ